MMTLLIGLIIGFVAGFWLSFQGSKRYDCRSMLQYSMKDGHGNCRFHAYFATRDDLDNSIEFMRENSMTAPWTKFSDQD